MYLPTELIHLILEYAGVIKWRNGKYMKQLLDVNAKYALLSERMMFDQNRKYYRITRRSFVNIPITHTEKSIYYFATDRGLRISLHRPDINNITDAEILYANMMQ